MSNHSAILDYLPLPKAQESDFSKAQESGATKTQESAPTMSLEEKEKLLTEGGVDEEYKTRSNVIHKNGDLSERKEGLHSWIVLIAISAAYTIISGGQAAFGVLFIELLPEFHQTKASTSIIYVIQNGVQISSFLLGPVIQKYGCRAVMIVGTILAFGGYVSSAFD